MKDNRAPKTEHTPLSEERTGIEERISDSVGEQPPKRGTRRDFMLAASAGVGALLLGRRAESLVPRSTRPPLRAAQPIGLQLYTLRDMMQRNVEYTLQQVAAIGYKEVEFAGLFDKSAKTVRTKMLDKFGLTSPSSHIPYDRLRSNLQAVVDEANALGNRFIVCPWLDAAVRKDGAAWRKIAADFNRFGEAIQRAGLTFAYHNHDFEFERLPDGGNGFDILLADCDPKLVKIELDLYWITHAGGDPLAYFAKWPGRFPLVHVKDRTGSGQITNVGQGSIDWNKIFAKRREAGIQHFFVENDNPKSPLEDIKASYTYMSKLGL